jgi:hypothetical protein
MEQLHKRVEQVVLVAAALAVRAAQVLAQQIKATTAARVTLALNLPVVLVVVQVRLAAQHLPMAPAVLVALAFLLRLLVLR